MRHIKFCVSVHIARRRTVIFVCCAETRPLFFRRMVCGNYILHNGAYIGAFADGRRCKGCSLSSCTASTLTTRAPILRAPPSLVPRSSAPASAARCQRPNPHCPHNRTMPHSPAVSPAPTPFRTASAATAHAPPEPVRLLAEVLKLRTYSFCQSNSNSVVSLPNVSKKDMRDYFSVSSRGRLSFVFTKLTKQFKLYCQLTKRK